MTFRITSCLLLIAACTPAATSTPPAPVADPVATLVAERERPVPHPVPYSRQYLGAVRNGTRSATGAPGARYWQQWTQYRLTARVQPDMRWLLGSADITYHNRSPDRLSRLEMEVTQNFHAPGQVRTETAEITGGVNLLQVEAMGTMLSAEDSIGPRYVVNGTRLTLHLPRAIAPGETARIRLEWAFTIPQQGGGARMGWSGDDLLFLAYWYPRMAVYDDITGWHTDPFLGPGELHQGFGSYNLTVEAPAGWLVRGTGRQTNRAETLSESVLRRFNAAEQSDTVVRVLTSADTGLMVTRAGSAGWLRWNFVADTVRDVAFSVTRRSNWDVARTPVGDRRGTGRTDYTRIESVWRPSAPRWSSTARYGQHAITFLSRYTGLPYPWPHMTAVEGGGIIGGGMEFPMMTLMGDYNARGDSALYYVTAHELAHMWVPMIVASDERRYGWVDEGITSFNENQSRMEFFPGIDHNLPDQLGYLELARAGGESEIMRWTDFYYNPQQWSIAAYLKPATVLVALRAVLGEETFNRGLQEFIRRWRYRHPTPWDLFRTFESVSGRDLSWFWSGWFFETWTLDQAITEVRTVGDSLAVTIEDRGLMPMPVLLVATLSDGTRRTHTLPVEPWLQGRRTQITTIPASGVTRLEIDPDLRFPDIDRSNNTWQR